MSGPPSPLARAANGPTLVVMAAGLGSRFGGAKQFFGLGPSGEVLADYSLFDAWRAGFSRAVFVVRPEHESVILERFAPGWKGRLEVVTAHQRLDDLPGGLKPPSRRTKPWGTAHAVWSARKELAGPFAVINADDFYGRKAFEAMRQALSARPGEGALVGYALGATLSDHGTVARAVCRVGEDRMLRALVECRKIRGTAGNVAAEDHPEVALSEDSLVSMNFWGLPASALSLFEPHLASLPGPDGELALPEVVGELIRQGALDVRVLPEGRDWIGVTYREDAPAAAARLKALVEKGEYPANLI